MEEKKQYGGARKGAGRKPTDNPKEMIYLYVAKKDIWTFGNKEKLREAVYGFIANKNAEVAVRPAETTVEIPRFEQPTIITGVPRPSVRKLFPAYSKEIDEVENDSDGEKLLAEIREDKFLTKPERMSLISKLTNGKLTQ